MTPKERASYLIQMFEFEIQENEIIPKFRKHKAKQCAIIAVDMLIQQCDDSRQHWEEVKQEIEKL